MKQSHGEKRLAAAMSLRRKPEKERDRDRVGQTKGRTN